MLSNRTNAFEVVDGCSEFQGDRYQFAALCVAAKLRGYLEGVHCGEVDRETSGASLVRWEGMQSTLAQTAPVCSEWVQAFSNTAGDEMKTSLPIYVGRLERLKSSWANEMNALASIASDWTLPQAGESAVDDLLELARQAAIRKSGRKRDPDDRVTRMIGLSSFVQAYFTPYTKGDQRPARAALSGKKVEVETEGRWVDWSEISHLDQRAMMGFNIGLSDHIVSSLRAIDKVRDWYGTDAPFPWRLQSGRSELPGFDEMPGA